MSTPQEKERRRLYNLKKPLPRPRTREEGPCSVLHMLLKDANLLEYEDKLHGDKLSADLLHSLYMLEDSNVVADNMLRDSGIVKHANRLNKAL